jgi:hypothetical protein
MFCKIAEKKSVGFHGGMSNQGASGRTTKEKEGTARPDGAVMSVKVLSVPILVSILQGALTRVGH